MPKVSVIIPTTAEEKRFPLLQRAVTSASQPDTKIIIVANGPRTDPAVVASFRNQPNIIVTYREEGNVSAARMAGLKISDTDFFCFLDDDDELLSGALDVRIHTIGDFDILVTNGYRNDGTDRPLVTLATDEINRDPVGSFLQQNWFASPASLFRASAVPTSLFDIKLKYFEWTWLFFNLHLSGVKIKFSGEYTYRINEGHGPRASRSETYTEAYAPFLHSLTLLPIDAKYKITIRKNYQTALNAASIAALSKGLRYNAWCAHFRCLFAGGWQYLPYTRRLLLPSGK